MSKFGLMRILTTTIAFFSFIQIGTSQTDKSLYSSYKTTADSIVKYYYGDTLLRFITLDSNVSYYRTLKTGGGGTMSKLTQSLNFEPEMFVFHYYLTVSSFNGDILNIIFYVDKNHRIMEGFSPEGLFDMKGQNGLNVISKAKALSIAKKSKIKKPLDKYEVLLGWAEHEASSDDYKRFNQTKDIKDIVKGRIVWRVRSHFRIAKYPDERPFSETFLVDAITGEIIGVEHDKATWG